MEPQQSALVVEINRVIDIIERGEGLKRWIEVYSKTYRIIELVVGDLKVPAKMLLLVVKLAELWKGITLVLKELRTEQQQQETVDCCKLAAALLSWYNKGSWGCGIPFSKWEQAANKLLSIVDALTVRKTGSTKAIKLKRLQQQLAFTTPLMITDEILQQILAAFLHDLCKGRCTAAAELDNAKALIVAALGRQVFSTHPAAKQYSADGAGSSAAAAAVTGSKDNSSAQDASTQLRASDAAAPAESDTAATAGQHNPGRTGQQPQQDDGAGSSQQVQERAGPSQQPKKQPHRGAADNKQYGVPPVTRTAAHSQHKDLTLEQAEAAAAVMHQAAASAGCDWSEEEYEKFLVTADDDGSFAVGRTMRQMFSQRTRTIRDEAAADCQQRLVQLFRGHSINDALEDLIELLHKQRRDVERIIEISPGSLFKGFEIYDRMLRSMDRLSFNHKRTLPEHYGKVEKEVLGAGGFGRVVQQKHIKSGEMVAVKQVVLNIYPAASGKKKHQIRKTLRGDFAGINITTPRQAAKEYLVAHDIASAAPGMVAKPYGAWIHEEVDGDMKVVVLNTPMPQGRDLNSVKIAVVGNDEDNQFKQLPRAAQELLMESLALTFGRGVAQALSKTHSRLVYHSDIKMGNCIIMTEGISLLEAQNLRDRLEQLLSPPVNIALIDWGMSRTAHPVAGQERHSKIVHWHGTPYLRPFELAGAKDLKNATPVDVDKLDVFCLGFVIGETFFMDYTDINSPGSLEMSARCQLEFSDMSSTSLPAIRARVKELIVKMQDAGASSALVQLVKRCVAERPADRPTAHEVFQACTTGLAHLLPQLCKAQLLTACQTCDDEDDLASDDCGINNTDGENSK